MSSERWARVNEVFHRATELEGAARARYLEEACAGDAELLDEVRSLLDADGRASGDFLETPAGARPEAPPVRIGAWRVVRELGRGGMGTVYLVERADGTFTMTAALKLLRRGLDTDDLLARFRDERQILATLEHPNIARLLDGGATDDGRPWLAMEYVPGHTLLEACERRGLDRAARLKIFRKLIDAVAYAHRNRVVHRDLKPGNVLVSESGEPKLLDFGIAKVLEPHGDQRTRTGAMLLTPAYASPEQIRGERITAATDIWALGVILYEVLTGRLPFDGTRSPIVRQILDDDVPPPRLGADLDGVIFTALHKDPAQRYPSVEALADDLDRLQSGLPLRARRATVGYRLVKFVQRHRLAVSAASLVGLAVTGVAVAVALWPSSHPEAPKAESIAVLPFENTSKDPEADYLSDGLTESVIYQLTRTMSLRVMSRSSVYRARAETKTPLEAGKKLGVDIVLVGELAPRGLVRAELVDIRTGAELWGARWDLAKSDAVEVQQRIAEGARATLDPASADKGRARAGALQQPRDAEAFTLYLRGRYWWNKRTADGLQLAATTFQQALDRDPAYAPAWVGLADSFALMEQYAGAPARETCRKAKAAVSKALELDPALATAHATHGLLLGHCDFEWAAAEAELKQAIELDPNYATAHHWYALHLAYRGLFERGLEHAKEAQRLDPLSVIASNAASVVNGYWGKWDDVITLSDRLIAMDARSPIPRIWKGRALRARGDLAGARTELLVAFELSGERSFEVMGDLGAVAALAGDAEETARWRTRLERGLEKNPSVALQLALVAASSGEKEAALAWLERAFEAGSWFLVQLRVDPLLAPLKGDPRFEAMVARVHRP